MDTPTLTDLKRKPAHPLTFAMDIETKTHPSMNSTRLNDSQKRLLPASLGLAFFIFHRACGYPVESGLIHSVTRKKFPSLSFPFPIPSHFDLPWRPGARPLAR